MNFEVIRDTKGNIDHIATSLTGEQLLLDYQLNKDSAFTEDERKTFGLIGKIPYRVETIEEQAKRCYEQYSAQPTDVAKYTYLNNLHNRNETLFYKVVEDNLEEMMPIVYTPTVGAAIEQFSTIHRQTKGLIISYPDQAQIETMLDNYDGSDIDVIVVTDAEGILGIGDQGVGGIYISIGKLAVYTLCANLDPNRVLPIHLDVGTNNEKMLNDPLYLGWRHERVRGKEYDDFIDAFVAAVRKKFPDIYLHWEDFGKETARRNLDRYIDKMCTFNDDMQGTGIVTLSALLSGVLASGQKLTEQKIIFHGAGTSATGIADQICDAMVLEGLTPEEARARIWMVRSKGLIKEGMEGLTPYQDIYSRSNAELNSWNVEDPEHISLMETVKNVKPTALIGVSTQPNAFTEEIVKFMAKHVERPIILPLSNPTSKAEAIPADVMRWTNNKALVATGSPFPNVTQCNNAFAFPGLGVGIIAAKAKLVTKGMIWAACQALTKCSPVYSDAKSSRLLPYLDEVKAVSHKVAIAVVKQAIKEGVADEIADIETEINKITWEPKYYPYKKK